MYYGIAYGAYFEGVRAAGDAIGPHLVVKTLNHKAFLKKGIPKLALWGVPVMFIKKFMTEFILAIRLNSHSIS